MMAGNPSKTKKAKKQALIWQPGCLIRLFMMILLVVALFFCGSKLLEALGEQWNAPPTMWSAQPCDENTLPQTARSTHAQP